MIIADLVAAGWSLETLSNMPLESWVEFYKSVRSRELERSALMVSIMHSGNPQSLRQSLMNESKRIGMGKDAEWWRDPSKVKSFAKTLPGVSIREEKVK